MAEHAATLRSCPGPNSGSTAVSPKDTWDRFMRNIIIEEFIKCTHLTSLTPTSCIYLAALWLPNMLLLDQQQDNNPPDTPVKECSRYLGWGFFPFLGVSLFGKVLTSYDPLLVSIDVDNSGQPVLTSKGVFVCEPDDNCNGHIPVGRLPLGPDEQVWSCSLAPFSHY